MAISQQQYNQIFENIGERIPEMLQDQWEIITQWLAASVTDDYMRDRGTQYQGTPNQEGIGAGTLRIITGRLARSFVNAADARAGTREGIREFSISGDDIRMSYGSSVPYARKHEIGQGVPERPFLAPAYDDNEDDIWELIREGMYNLMLEEIDKVEGIKK